MKIPIQFFGMNYLSRLINSFTDSEGEEFPELKYHELQVESSIPLKKKDAFSVGISAKELSLMLRELTSKKGYALDGLAICKEENLIFSGYRTPYNEQLPHITNSTCKTVIAIAIMFAISEDLLQEEDYVLSFFPEYESVLNSKYIKKMKIKHLLTMTSGSRCNEIFSLVELNWVKAFLQTECAFCPGEYFVYNSMNTYMLAAILQKVTGQSVMEYLEKRFFCPLGICHVKWELCPMGIEKGGWGLHISLEGMLKIGIFLAQDGCFQGKQLIHPSYIKKMKDVCISQDADDFATGYGYQFWHLPKGLYLLSGMYGQNVIFDEEHHLVVATNAHNDKMFPDSPIVRIIVKYITKESFYHPQSKQKEKIASITFENEFKAFCNDWKLPKSFLDHSFLLYSKKQEKLKKIQIEKLNNIFTFFDGKRLHMDQVSIKLFPYLMQGMYHIQPFHITDIIFKKEKDFVNLYFYKERTKKEIKKEKNKERLWIKAGYAEYCYQTIKIGKEEKQIAVRVYPTMDEEENSVLILDIVFPAEGFSRFIKFFLMDNRIIVESQEYPDMRAILEQFLYGEAVIAGNTIDLTDKIPDSVRVFLDHKVEPRVNAYFFEK